jgi:hypothetical protein
MLVPGVHARPLARSDGGILFADHPSFAFHLGAPSHVLCQSVSLRAARPSDRQPPTNQPSILQLHYLSLPPTTGCGRDNGARGRGRECIDDLPGRPGSATPLSRTDRPAFTGMMLWPLLVYEVHAFGKYIATTLGFFASFLPPQLFFPTPNLTMLWGFDCRASVGPGPDPLWPWDLARDLHRATCDVSITVHSLHSSFDS